jgi:hypothetical protein
MRMIDVLPEALTRSRIHLWRFVRVVMPLVIAPALHGCATCGPDYRRTEVEGFLLDRTLTQVARLEVYLSELRNGVNPQLWVRIEDFGNDPDSLLRGRVTDARLLSTADDTLFAFQIRSDNGRTSIFAPGTIIPAAEANRIMDHITGNGVKLLLRSEVEGRSVQVIPMSLVAIGPWQRNGCAWP